MGSLKVSTIYSPLYIKVSLVPGYRDIQVSDNPFNLNDLKISSYSNIKHRALCCHKSLECCSNKVAMILQSSC